MARFQIATRLELDSKMNWLKYGLAKLETILLGDNKILLEWTTSLDTSSRTLFVREGGCPSGGPRHVERRVT